MAKQVVNAGQADEMVSPDTISATCESVATRCQASEHKLINFGARNHAMVWYGRGRKSKCDMAGHT